MAKPRVLILGGGFGGVGAAQKLGDANAEVVLVDRHDYHTFQPLLYQLATGLLETTAVGHSLRDLGVRVAELLRSADAAESTAEDEHTWFGHRSSSRIA